MVSPNELLNSLRDSLGYWESGSLEVLNFEILNKIEGLGELSDPNNYLFEVWDLSGLVMVTLQYFADRRYESETGLEACWYLPMLHESLKNVQMAIDYWELPEHINRQIHALLTQTEADVTLTRMLWEIGNPRVVH